ncbi:MAG TPA: hypothetical protein VKY59_09890 [Spirillospora sp.]|nr:hypothetical protein [Spirillospora sp.]
MLNLVLRLTGLLWGLLMVVLAVLLAGGNGRLPAQRAQIDYPGFDGCALPCWAGVTPSQTATGHAPQVMASHLAQTQLEFRTVVTQINFEATGPDAQFNGVIYDDRGVVGGLRFEVDVPLWKLLDALDTPACIRSHPGADGREVVTVSWETQNNVVSGTIIVPTWRSWRPSARVSLLGVFTRYPACAAPGERPWHGFAPLWRYRGG